MKLLLSPWVEEKDLRISNGDNFYHNGAVQTQLKLLPEYFSNVNGTLTSLSGINC